MKGHFFMFFGILLFLASCTATKSTEHSKVKMPILVDDNTFLLKQISTDNTYGYTEQNPIKVGGGEVTEGAKNERRFLNALTGPEGEQISYIRDGSCCQFESKNSPTGTGLLNIYVVTWRGQREPVLLYINKYDPDDKIQAPIGFTIK